MFKSVKPVKDSLVINLGETLSRATNFKLKATNHRVLDIGIERYSSPFFLEPAYSTVVPANLLDINYKIFRSQKRNNNLPESRLTVAYSDITVKLIVGSTSEALNFVSIALCY